VGDEGALLEGGELAMDKLRSRWWAWTALMGAATVVAMLAAACGGGSAGVDATPTVKPLPTLAEGAGTPVGPGGALGPGAGAFGGPGLSIGRPSEEFAAFLGISLDQLESELSAEGATPASVAEAHGRTREELKSFFIEQAKANLDETVADGIMTQEDADNLLEGVTSRIDGIIDGEGAFLGAGGPGPGLFVGGASEEFAAFLGISLDQLESELSAEGATPASVAEAHGRTRDELKSFFVEQIEGNLSDAVAAGTMSQEDADNQLANLTSRIDDIIDGQGLFPGAGGPRMLMGIGGASEEFAAFLGISLDQLESELSAEGATPASVAEAHGRTRDELKSFFIEQIEANLSDAVAAGTMSQEDADNQLANLTSRIDDIIDGNAPLGAPGQPPASP
jgi:uncharacterized coiled-coil protein SlyX